MGVRIDGKVITVSDDPVIVREFAIPGIVAAVAYTAGDAFGGRFEINVPEYGTITNVAFMDLDDEGINKDMVLFNAPFLATADNSPIALLDFELKAACIYVVQISTWIDFLDNRVGISEPALYYHAPKKKLWGQFVTRGVDNIAAGQEPIIRVTIR